ncbi:hypothetical protein EJB10_01995 [Wolbachia endosymbiont of Brugia malayi]|uniref:hypothetical protein n=1 Tax=Wolbachia endosymbiont of Brugia malayi TaxID=80849 RepID=UPI00004C9217|nr:hypothetical protein [Wolbachia endosymbiont of Brugia malayi]AAW70598.1 Predicted protein [Wolbachia endosymbiont strain TRS of Brugia malayi]QCB61587.1 hypothetical protein EJB10_01995 [Wolbachia endosymbiont of Brugia malayi]
MADNLYLYKGSVKITEMTLNLNEAKIIVYEDSGGNKYTLDASGISTLTNIDDIKLSDLLEGKVKFIYQKKDSNAIQIKGLGNIISTLLATQKAVDGESILAEEVSKKPVVDTILKATDLVNLNKNIVETELEDKFVKKDASNLTDAVNQKAFAEKILPAKDGQKSILVEKLGGLLGEPGAVYGDSNPKITAKDFLAEKASLVKTDGSNIVTQTDKGKALVEAILNAKEPISNKEVKIVETELAKTFVKTADLGTPAVAGKVLDAKDGQKSILVEKLGRFLDTTSTEYSNQTAKVFSGEKGTKPTAEEVVTKLLANNKKDLTDEVAQNPGLRAAVTSNSGLRGTVIDNLKGDTDFKTDITIQVDAKDPAFQGFVREIISQPSFEIPTSDDAPLSWDWI